MATPSILVFRFPQNHEEKKLGDQSRTAVEDDITEHPGPRGQERLMKFIKSCHQRRTHKRQHSPLRAPSRAEPREGAAPGAEQKNTQCGISHKVAALAQYDVQHREALRANCKQIMKDWIENPIGML